MAFLTRAAIIAAVDLAYEDVDVPEWGGTVRVTELNQTARELWQSRMVRVDENGDTHPNAAGFFDKPNPRILVHTLTDDHFSPLFTSPEALEELGRKSANVLDRLAAIVRRLSGMSTGPGPEPSPGDPPPPAPELTPGNSDTPTLSSATA